MTRLQDWPERLNDFITARRRRPFRYGDQDCTRFAADAVLAMTGTDPMEGLRDYTDQAGAQSMLDELGGLEAAATARLGAAISPATARRGDVVLLDVDGVLGLGICLGAHAAATGPRGLVFVDRGFWRQAWRVG